MTDQFSRTELLFGKEAMQKLAAARVAVFGIGGVGGYAVEALARSGIGALDLIDSDKVDVTNINRQIIATWETVGEYKVDAAAKRVLQINPGIKVTVHKTFFLPETADQFDFTQYDYVIDAIDTVAGKIALVMKAAAAGTPIMSSMGAGNKADPTQFKVADIYETSICPLAKVMRRELKKRGIEKLKVVYSTEPPIKPMAAETSSIRPMAAETSSIRPMTAEDPSIRPPAPEGKDINAPAPEGKDINAPAPGEKDINALAFERNDTDPLHAAGLEIPEVLSGDGMVGNTASAVRNVSSRRQIPGSNAFAPSVAGLIIAGEVIKDIIGFSR